MVVNSIRNATKFKQTVLVVDDQPTALDIHTAILKSLKLNLNIVSMTNAVEALKWMHNKQVDLIVIDFSMIQMNGMQFIQRVNNNNNKNVAPKPIIVITALKDKKLRQELIAAGASACFSKPVNATKLINMATSLLNKSKLFYSQQQTLNQTPAN